ncbi:MAG: hypothetical protein KDC45_09115 [Bacteroidetes bacterium]|nr:hypothetical protein [Bacteroidota bacterium]
MKISVQILCCIGLAFSPVVGQYETGIPHLRNFSPKEYDAHNQNWIIERDSLGVLFIGNTGGILTYDGVAWNLLHVRNQSVVRALGRATDGRIYVGAKGEIGYLHRDSIGQLQYVSLMDDHFPEHVKFSDVWSVQATKDGVFFSTTHALLRYRSGHFKVWTSSGEFDVGRAVHGRMLIREEGRGVLEVIGDSLVPVAGTEQLKDERIYFMVPWNDESIMVGTRSKGLFVFDKGVLQPFAVQAQPFLTEARIYNAQRLADSTLALATLRKGLVLLDGTGRLKFWLTNKSGLSDLNVRYVLEDPQGSLWLAMNNGLACVDWSSGITVLDDRHDLTGSIRDVRRFGGRLYVSTNQGAYVLEESSEDPKARFRPVEGIRNQAWSFVEIDGRLLLCTNDGLFEIRGGRGLRVNRLDGYQALRLTGDPTKVLLALRSGLALLNYQGGTFEEIGMVKNLTMDAREIADDKEGRIWLLSSGEGVARLSWVGSIDLNPEIERYDTSDGLPIGWVTSVDIRGEKRFGTIEGLFRFNEKKRRFEPDTTFNSALDLSRLNVFLMTEDGKDRIWARIAKKIGYFENTSEGLKWVERDLRPYRQNPIYNISTEGNGVVWFGTSDGLLRFEERSVRSALTPSPSYVRLVQVAQDSVVGLHLTDHATLGAFPYWITSIRFDFSSSSYSYESETEYQYILRGFDNAWSTWTKSKTKEYTNLSEGTYTFQVQSRSAYGVVGMPFSTEFSILAPWYRTWWAYVLYSMLLTLAIVGSVQWRVKSYRTQQRILERRIEERTAELRQKNAELESTLAKLQAAQNQMVQSEKLMALGNLIAGVAHEINNPVTFIYSNISHLRQYVNELKELLREAERIHTAEGRAEFDRIKSDKDFEFIVEDLEKLIRSYENGSERITQIVGNLRRFSRSNDLQVRDVDLRESLTDTLAILTPQFKYRINVHTEFGNLPTVQCNAGEIQQVFMNLLANAAYAVELRNTQESRQHGNIRVDASVLPATADGTPWVQFRIRDDGTGMTTEVQNRIFDPFFTTKPVGQGTGLGLSISHSIIEKHGGKLYFVSREGEGTDFFIELPIRHQESS